MSFIHSADLRFKLDAFAGGGKLRVLDLFSGCGGLSLGFEMADCVSVGGVELTPERAMSYAKNFHPDDISLHGRARDITNTTPAALIAELGLGLVGRAVDIVVGGPPCQAYARVGRAKLRTVHNDDLAYLSDQRGILWQQYLRFVQELQPLALLMENVPDILNYGGENVAEHIAEQLDAMGYCSRYSLRNAANYGVPQTRERWYLLAVHKALNVEPTFPEPEYALDLPIGYRGTRGRAIAMQAASGDARSPYFAALPDLVDLPHQAVTCHDALSDLPPIAPATMRRGNTPQRMKELVEYRAPATNKFQQHMRNFGRFASGEGVTAHVTRYLPRDFEIFRRMPEGGDYLDAHETAVRIFNENLGNLRTTRDIPDFSEEWERLRRDTVPPYSREKFPNKWGKMKRDFPARTLMAHLAHDSYTHIHYDAAEARTLSVREAARLQSFPDGFQFHGAMNAAFGQIGNAVPPLVAKAMATQLIDAIQKAVDRIPNFRQAS
jgi:DNA (cytosine-5)-methyltransferase 1